MFRITAETCRRFTLAEALIMAAINVETLCLTFEPPAISHCGSTEFCKTLYM
jgi:hypothetical protein